jgi:hypothetical protein
VRLTVALELDLLRTLALRWAQERNTRPTLEHGKRSTVATVAVPRELAGFLWAAATDQPLLEAAA